MRASRCGPARTGPSRRGPVRMSTWFRAPGGRKRCMLARFACCYAPLGKVLGCRGRRGCLIFVSVLMHRILRWRTRRQSRHSVPGRKRCWRESNSAFYLRVRFVPIHIHSDRLVRLPRRSSGPAGASLRGRCIRRVRWCVFCAMRPTRRAFTAALRSRDYSQHFHFTVSSERTRSLSADRCASVRLANPFSRIITFSRPQRRPRQRAFSRNASGDH